MANFIDRSITTFSISEFYQNHILKRYNYEPSYQRGENVWDIMQKSFLIDSILKNLPIQQVILHQKINSKGQVTYDVIDGKQRLLAIADFIEGKVNLPNFFSDDILGDKRLNGISFNKLKCDQELESYLAGFWKYKLSVEYISTNYSEIISSIFDRVNRNGEKLNRQELRNAKYSSTDLYHLVVDLANTDFWRERLQSLKINRMDDKEFISELIFTLLENDLFSSTPEFLDKLFEKWSVCTENELGNVREEFMNITQCMKEFNLNYEDLNISKVTHLYGIWCFAWYCLNNNIKPSEVSNKLNLMFINLRNDNEKNETIIKYKQSMDSNTKSKSQRQNRLNAIKEYCVELEGNIYQYFSEEIFKDLNANEFYKQNAAITNLRTVLPDVLNKLHLRVQRKLGNAIVEIAPSNSSSGSFEAANFLNNLDRLNITFEFLKGIFNSTIIRQYMSFENEYYLWITNEYLGIVLKTLMKYQVNEVSQAIDQLISKIENSKIHYYSTKKRCIEAVEIIENISKGVNDTRKQDKLFQLKELISELGEKSISQLL